MAPRRPDKKSKKHNISRAAAGGSSENDGSGAQQIPIATLLKAAEHHLSEGNPSDALILAKTAYDQQLSSSSTSSSSSDNNKTEEELLPTLNILGQINLELGELGDAKTCFLKAAEIDPDGHIDENLGGGAEKFLCLAQLSDEGGQDSVGWFDRGAAALKYHISKLESKIAGRTATATAAAAIRRKRIGGGGGVDDETEGMELEILKKKLAMTLCSVAEVYMTDLSWESDAEARCEALVTEATLVAPDSADSWQTLASVRVSQDRREDAKAALGRSMEIWSELAPDDLGVPDFPSRVALARLLMEVEMEEKAVEVLERLVGEDDHSVEVWYLGGWALYVLGEKQRGNSGVNGAEKKDGEEEDEDWKTSWVSSRVWLTQSQHLYKMQEYEDERLGEHTKELLQAIAKELGEMPEGGDEIADEDGWEDDEDDEEMEE